MHGNLSCFSMDWWRRKTPAKNFLRFPLLNDQGMWRDSSKSEISSCCCSVTQSCATLCDPMGCSTWGFPVLHHLPEFAQTSVHWVGDAIQHLIFCHPLFLLPSIFPGIRVFSKESILHIRWPKYWSFRFSISPSNEYSGLISFRIDWFDWLSRVFSNTTVQKHQFFHAQISL